MKFRQSGPARRSEQREQMDAITVILSELKLLKADIAVLRSDIAVIRTLLETGQ